MVFLLTKLITFTASIRSAAVRSSGVFRRRAAPCFGEANLRTISRPACNVFGTRLRVTEHSRRAERCRQTVRMRIASIDGDQREAMWVTDCHQSSPRKMRRVTSSDEWWLPIATKTRTWRVSIFEICWDCSSETAYQYSSCLMIVECVRESVTWSEQLIVIDDAADLAEKQALCTNLACHLRHEEAHEWVLLYR